MAKAKFIKVAAHKRKVAEKKAKPVARIPMAPGALMAQPKERK